MHPGRGSQRPAQPRAETQVAGSMDDLAWRKHANCRDHPTEVFFPEGCKGNALHAQEQTAKSICCTCLVRGRCLQYALEHPEPHGIWGALAARERAAILQRRSARTDGKRHPTRKVLLTHGADAQHGGETTNGAM